MNLNTLILSLLPTRVNLIFFRVVDMKISVLSFFLLLKLDHWASYKGLWTSGLEVTLVRSGISPLSMPTFSATFRNSPTLSIRIKNFLYRSKASLHCFLFMSKYFSENKKNKLQNLTKLISTHQTWLCKNEVKISSWYTCDSLTFCYYLVL